MARDFRKSYYSTLGVRVVEIKNSTESLLQEDVLDLEKLSLLCFRFGIPASYRSLVWQILLGIKPKYKVNWQYVHDQMQREYEDLRLAHQLLYGNAPTTATTAIITNPTTASSITKSTNLDDFGNLDDPLHVTTVSQRMVEMCLIYLGQSRVHHHSKKSKSPYLVDTSFQNLAAAFYQLVRAEMEAFWVFLRFLKTQRLLQSNSIDMHSPNMSSKINNVSRLLQQRDAQLYEHFKKHDVSIDVFAYRCMKTFLAGSLPTSSLERIWDIIISGPPGMIVYVITALLTTSRRHFFNFNNGQDIKEHLQQMSFLPTLNIDTLAENAIALESSEKIPVKLDNINS